MHRLYVRCWPKADIEPRSRRVRFGPLADLLGRRVGRSIFKNGNLFG
jgi:hypothetical protein